MATHNNRHRRMDRLLRLRMLPKPLHPLQVALLLTRMPSMAVTRTTWQCGMHPLPSNKAAKVPKDPQVHSRHLVAVTDAHLAELHRMLHVCMTNAWIFAAPGMTTIPDFLDLFFSTS
jgi:hypothetical protein